MQIQRNFQRRMHQLPMRARFAVTAAFCLSISTYTYAVYYTFFKNHTADKAYLQVETCPLCYGESLCHDLLTSKASYESFSRLQFINSLANLKNVNLGSYRGYPVAFKKLAHDSELAEFDSQYSGESANDVPFPGISRSKNLNINEVKGISDFMACPTDRLLDRLLLKYIEKADAVDLRYPEKLSLLTTLHINPEPLILQTFPKSEGWPFPEYYGACGRFVVVENVGKSLAHLYNSEPWSKRVNYAYQVMQIAEQLTNNPTHFALYFTDVQADNFAVDETGKVRIVDAENIIVVDKWMIEREKEPGWNQPFYQPYNECETGHENCLTVHKTLLCKHQSSDFNYYAVCKGLLSSYASEPVQEGGLLFDTPAEVEKNYGLSELLRQCAKPDNPSGRFDAKDKLLKVLKTLSLTYF